MPGVIVKLDSAYFMKTTRGGKQWKPSPMKVNMFSYGRNHNNRNIKRNKQNTNNVARSK